MMHEILKPIPEYEGLYEVSNLGYVKSVDRVVKHTYGGEKRLKGKILQPSTVRYPVVILCKNGTIKYKTLARIVAKAFIPNEDNLPEVNHIDKNKLNCRADNLEWTTRRENETHKNLSNTNLTSKYPGVYWHRRDQKWVAQICINNKQKQLGYFENELDAFTKYYEAMLANGITNKYVQYDNELI